MHQPTVHHNMQAIASSDVSRGKKAAKVDNPAQKRESIVLVDDEDQLQGQLKSRDSLSMDAVTERARAKYALARPWESSVQGGYYCIGKHMDPRADVAWPLVSTRNKHRVCQHTVGL